MTLALATRAEAARVDDLALDDDGFLIDRRIWSREVAQHLAGQRGLGQLGETHWLIINYIRDKYFRLGALPPMRNMCRKLGLEREAVKNDFGSCRMLWQVAGLPNPGPEALSYMG